MTFKLMSTGGLCNRLRATLSHLVVHRQLEVQWDEGLTATGQGPHFHDLFEPIEGLSFIPGNQGAHLVSCGIADRAPSDWTEVYRSLRPKPAIAAAIAQAKASLGDLYVAIHVRRTDMVKLAAMERVTLPTDDEYRAFLANFPDWPVWLATDNGETQRKYLHDPTLAIPGAVPPRVRMLAPLGGTEDHPSHEHHGPIADAVVDLFVCAGATHFMGSAAFGSFSWTIEVLRSLGKCPQCRTPRPIHEAGVCPTCVLDGERS